MDLKRQNQRILPSKMTRMALPFICYTKTRSTIAVERVFICDFMCNLGTYN